MDGLAIATAAKVDAEERNSTAVTRTALVRGVPSSFCDALAMEMPSSPVDLERARAQHAAYVKVLQGNSLAHITSIQVILAQRVLPSLDEFEDQDLDFSPSEFVLLVATLQAPCMVCI